ncbi:MAG: polysaccharide biosynthesis protein [Clostridiaceae bacterium]
MRVLKNLALIVIDFTLINLSFLISFFIIAGVLQIQGYNKFFIDILIISIIYLIIFSIFRLYKSIWTLAGFDEFIFAVSSGFCGSLISFSYNYFSKDSIPLNMLFLASILIIFSTVSIRVLFRIYRRLINKIIMRKNHQIKVLIIGAGCAGALVAREIKNYNYHLIGFIDDNINKLNRILYGVRVLGTREDILEIVKNYKVNQIIIALPSANKKEINEIITICKNTNCKLKKLTSIYEIINGNIALSDIKDVEVEDLLGRDVVNLNIDSISEFLNNKVILVTGGGGSIGSELCKQIAKFKPQNLIIIDIYENNAYDIQNELTSIYPELKLTVLIASIRDNQRIEEIFGKYKPSVVFHAAAHKHVPLMEVSPKAAIKNNILGTWNVAKAADKFNVEKFVLISTDKAVNPTNIMGATKRFCEMIVQAMNKESSTEFTAVRFGNVLGSNGSVIPLFKKQILNGGPVTVTSKEVTRFFMTIPEAAQLVIQAGAFANGGEIFILDMGSPVRIYDLAYDLIKLSGYEPNKDIEIKITGLRQGEKLQEELLMNEEGLQKTLNEKIFITKPLSEDIEVINKNIRIFEDLIKLDSDKQLIEQLKFAVPTFRHNKN